MAGASITATTAATIHGRLLAQTAAVTLDTNTITKSNCASSASGSGGGTETTTPAEATTLAEGVALAQALGSGVTGGPKAVAGPRGAPRIEEHRETHASRSSPRRQTRPSLAGRSRTRAARSRAE